MKDSSCSSSSSFSSSSSSKPYWPDGVARHLSSPPSTLYDNLRVAAERDPQKTAVHYYGGVISYAQLLREVDALAGFVEHRCGVACGDRVALFMQNSPQFVIGYFAILRAHAVIVPINPMSTTDELKHIVEDCNAKTAILSEELFDVARALHGGSLDHLIVARYADSIDQTTDLPLPAAITAAPLDADVFAAEGITSWRDAIALNLQPSAYAASVDDLAVIPYTSGTTGTPKGCMHTHRSAHHVVAASVPWCDVHDDAIVLCSLPAFHVTGMQHTMNVAIRLGATMVMMTRWDSHCAARLIERYRISYWNAISTMMIDFLSLPDLERYDFNSLKMICGGGAAMPKALAQRMASCLALAYVEGYGLSETIGATHINPPQRCKQQCLGIPIQDTDALVVEPTTLQVLEQGATGEIVVSGPQIFEGYWGKPDATRDAFVEVLGKRYLRTGDLGYIDEDGYFFFVDRLKRMINASGYKVWPAEVETLLFGHPAIREACVVAARDARRGETVKAFVVLREGEHATAAEIVAWAHEHMASYKVPTIVEFIAALPRTGSGKVQWRLLQERE